MRTWLPDVVAAGIGLLPAVLLVYIWLLAGRLFLYSECVEGGSDSVNLRFVRCQSGAYLSDTEMRVLHLGKFGPYGEIR
jgi:hypothetical protein